MIPRDSRSCQPARITPTTRVPSRQRLGWLVRHRHARRANPYGNLVVEKRREAEHGADNREGQNVTDLHRFATADYLTPHSDIVALMVLEHQAALHNRIARASLETRMALHYQEGMKGSPRAAQLSL